MLWNQIIRLEWGWCEGKKCSSQGFTILKWGILLAGFFINCEITSAQQPSSKSSFYKKQSSHHHSPWGSWSTSESSIHPWDEDSTIMPNIVPLTLKEQSIRESKKQSQKQSHSSIQRSQSQNTNTNGNKSSKRDYEKDLNGKSGSRNNDDNNAGNMDENQRGSSDNNGKADPKSLQSLLDGLEMYYRAAMNFEVFEIELFLKPQFTKTAQNPDVWKDMMM